MRIKYICIFASSLLYSSLGYSETVPLSKAEQQSIVGGTFIDISTFNSGERLGSDEIEIRGTITQTFTPSTPLNTNDIRISQRYGPGKAKITTVSTTASDVVGSTRVTGSFVLNDKFTLNISPATYNLRICNGDEGIGIDNGTTIFTPACTTTAIGSQISDIDIDESIKVRGIWFHNLIDGNQASFVPEATLTPLVDWIVNSGIDNVGEKPFNLDELYGQCDINRRLQFRSFRYDTVDASSWLPLATDWTRFNTPGVAPAIPVEYRNHADSIDSQGRYIHIYIVNDLGGSVVGVSNGFSDNVLAIEDSFVTGSTFEENMRLLAHEIGHSQGLRHFSGNGICDGTTNSDIMCDSTGTFGNNLTSSQCQTSFNSTSGISDLDNP